MAAPAPAPAPAPALAPAPAPAPEPTRLGLSQDIATSKGRAVIEWVRG